MFVTIVIKYYPVYITFQKPELIATYSQSVGHPYGMVHYSSLNKVTFYWTEFREGHIRCYDQTTNTTVIIRNESIPLYEIRLFDNTSQTGIMLTPDAFIFNISLR